MPLQNTSVHSLGMFDQDELDGSAQKDSALASAAAISVSFVKIYRKSCCLVDNSALTYFFTGSASGTSSS